MKIFGFGKIGSWSADIMTSEGVAPLPDSKKGFRHKLLILGIDACYFHKEVLADNLKISKSFIKMNYGHLSPYDEWDCVYKTIDNQLLIWFFPMLKKRYIMVIPEALLLIKSVNRKKGIFCLSTNSKLKFVVVTNYGIIEEQFAQKLRSGVRDSRSSETEKYIRNKYNDPELTLFHREPSHVILGLAGLEYNEIKGLLNFSFYGREFGQSFFPLLKIGTLIILFVYIISSYWVILDLSVKEQKVEKELSLLQQKNKSIKKQIFLVENKKEFWKTFEEQELLSISTGKLLETVAVAVVKHNSIIEEIKVSHENVNMRILTPDVTDFMEELIASDLFEDIKVGGKIIIDNKSKKSRVNLIGKIK